MGNPLLVLLLILGQSICSVQPEITVLKVNEHTCVNVPCGCRTQQSISVRWIRDADVDGVIEQQISCNRTNCYDIDCDQKQNTKLSHHHKILPNGDLQINRVEKRDSGLYSCLNEPSRGSRTECVSTSSFCTSGDHEEESAGAVTQSSCEAALLLYIISDSPQESKDYKIHIKTGDVYWAGTDSNVYITMCGRLECLRSYHLKHSSTHYDPFEQGQVDVFTVRSRYLGNLENVTIWHDGSGRHPSWILENIRITETFSGMEQTFTCSCQVEGNKPKTLYPQVPGSCDSLHENEPKIPYVPNPLIGTPLLSCEIQNPPSSKFSLLWMFRSTEGQNRVIAVAGTWADILASCLGKNKDRNHEVLEPGQDSCPESSHCLLPPSGVTRDDLERYWCLIGPGEDESYSSVSPSVQNITKTPPGDQKETTQGGLTQQQKIIIPVVILSVLGILLIVTLVFCFRRLHKENVYFQQAAGKCSAPCKYSFKFYPGDEKKVPGGAQPTELADDETSYAVIEFDRGVTRFA